MKRRRDRSWRRREGEYINEGYGRKVGKVMTQMGVATPSTCMYFALLWVV